MAADLRLTDTAFAGAWTIYPTVSSDGVAKVREDYTTDFRRKTL